VPGFRRARAVCRLIHPDLSGFHFIQPCARPGVIVGERIHIFAAIARHGRPELEKGDIILSAAPGADDGHESRRLAFFGRLADLLFPGEADAGEGLALPALLGVHQPIPSVRRGAVRESRVEEAAVLAVK
jgi:hypothetical protein